MSYRHHKGAWAGRGTPRLVGNLCHRGTGGCGVEMAKFKGKLSLRMRSKR